MNIPEFYYPEVSSTMTRAREIISLGKDVPLENGIFRVRTDHQTAGRGRRGRRWIDLPGQALMMTIAVKRRGPFDPGDPNPGTLALRTGAAVLEVVRHLIAGDLNGLGIAGAPRVTIKWPNDVLIDDRKVAGILLEADSRWYYVGIGINFYDPFVPDGLEIDGTTGNGHEAPPLPTASVREFAAIDRIDTILPAFDASFLASLSGDRWWRVVETHLAWRDDGVVVSNDEGVTLYRGTVSGIAPDGALQLRTTGGVVRCYAGSIRRQN